MTKLEKAIRVSFDPKTYDPKDEFNYKNHRFEIPMTKLEKAIIVFLLVSLGWFLGRITEAIALGNI